MTARQTPEPESDITAGDTSVRDPSAVSVVSVFVAREIRTIYRTKGYVLLIGLVFAVVFGLVVVNNGLTSGYGPVVVDLLTPMEFLAPVLAVAFGYRAILGDSQRGELEILQTYPASAWQQVLGVFIGRGMGVSASVLGPLILVGTSLGLSSGRIWVFATPTGVDSPILFIRFAILTVLFALVLLSMAIGLSAIATTGRMGIILGASLLVLLIIGGDLGIIAGLTRGWIPDSLLVYALGLNPNSAYRGLVLETVIGTTTTTKAASPLVNLTGLILWGVSGVLVATFALRHRYPSQ